MDRYQIITNKDRPIAYKFKHSANSNTVYNYMKKCIEDKVLFEAGNISEDILEKMSVKISKNYKVPILTSKKRMNLMKIIYNYKEIYNIDNFPSKYRNILCLWDAIPIKELKSFLRIIRNPVNKS